MFMLIIIASFIFITMLTWRYTEFSQPWKGIFSLTILPVFIIGMVASLWFIDTVAPYMFESQHELYTESQNRPDSFFESRAARRTRNAPLALTTFIISTPIAFGLSYGWYRLMRSFAPESR